MGSILGCGFLAWQLRLYRWNDNLEQIAQLPLDGAVHPMLPFAYVSFVPFLFTGFCIGASLAFFMLMFLVKPTPRTRT